MRTVWPPRVRVRSSRGAGARGCLRLAVALAVLSACVPAPIPILGAPRPAFYRSPELNSGSERYSAWYGDSDGRVLYFGASPFWTLWWERGGDPLGDIAEPGDHLIGRFDLERRRFLAPLRVRSAGPDSRSSVWDVLVHSNGRVYYTTFFEEMGSVRRDGTEVRHYTQLGVGLNELFEGPEGRIYVTRYASGPSEEQPGGFGAVVVATPDGDLVSEVRFEKREGVFTAPKSVAVDPLSGEIWLNADLFTDDGEITYGTLHLSPGGEVLEEHRAPPELQFVSFDRDGTGWFVEDRAGEVWLRVTRGGEEIASRNLESRRRGDIVQDIKPFGEGQAVLALWSARAFIASVRDRGIAVAEVRFERPADCVPPQGRSLLYTAVVHGGDVYATLYCGWTVLRAPLPSYARFSGP